MDSPRFRRTAGLLGASGFLAVLLAAAAVFAIMVVLFSGEPIHRLWGAWACAGYGSAALIVVAWKGPRGKVVAAGVSLAGAVLGPLAQLAATGRNMPEVSVIEHAAALLVQHGGPYALTAQQGGPGFLRYDPYLPAMTIPRRRRRQAQPDQAGRGTVARPAAPAAPRRRCPARPEPGSVTAASRSRPATAPARSPLAWRSAWRPP